MMFSRGRDCWRTRPGWASVTSGVSLPRHFSLPGTFPPGLPTQLTREVGFEVKRPISVPSAPSQGTKGRPIMGRAGDRERSCWYLAGRAFQVGTYLTINR